MNTHAPPEIKRGGRLAPATPKTNELPQGFHSYGVASIWQREAARLFGEFWRTGEQRHIDAFARHVVGMRQRMVGA